MLEPNELYQKYVEKGISKTKKKSLTLFLLGIQSGLFLSFACIGTMTIGSGIEAPGIGRLMVSLLFPCGLIMIMLTGTELFTGNTLIIMTILEKKTTYQAMLRNWFFVYTGNFVGMVSTAALFACTSKVDRVALFTMETAATKASLGLVEALILGVFCNILVVTAVLMSMGGKSLVDKAVGAFVPVALFMMAGFEHSIANMFYLTLGVALANIPEYSALAIEAGVNVADLTVGKALFNNLIPVTIGNTIGGLYIGVLFWYTHMGKGGQYRDGSRGH